MVNESREPGSRANSGRNRRRRYWVLASVAVVVVVIAGIAAGAAFGVVPVPGFIWSSLTGAKSPEHSARYYPDGTSAYAWLSLAPGAGQLGHVEDIWDRLNEIPEFEDLYDLWVEEFEDDVEADFEDLRDWAGPDFSAAIVVDDREGETLLALTIGVRDQGAAEDFLDDWLDYMDRSEGADFESDDYEGFDIWVDEYEEQAYGLSGDLLVFANTEDFLEEVIDGINGDLDDTLADNESFKEARAALPENRFASVYFDYDDRPPTVYWLEDLDLDDLDSELRQTTPGVLEALDIDWAAAAASWGDRSITVELVMPSPLDHSLEFPSLQSPASLLPEDTLFLASLAFDSDMDNWRETLEEHEISEVFGEYAVEDLNDTIESLEDELDISGLPTATQRSGLDLIIDLGIAVVDELTGVDLERDFFEYLEGDLSLAGWDLSLDDLEGFDEDRPPGLIALLPYTGGGEDALPSALEEVLEVLEDEGDIRFESVDIGADEDAQILYSELDGYTPGYVLSDGYLIFGLHEDSLSETVDSQRSRDDSLDTNPEYQRAVGHLNADGHARGYLDLNALIREADSNDLEIYADGEYVDGQEILQASIAAVAAQYTLGKDGEDGLDRYVVVLTLFPE